MRRTLAWIGGLAAALCAVLLMASALYPELTANLIAHATPSISLFHNFLAANTHGDGGVTGLSLATAAIAIPARNLQAILGEAKAIQDKWKGKPMPEADAQKFDALVLEAQPMQEEIDRDVKVAEMNAAEQRRARLKSIPGGATLPAGADDKSDEDEGLTDEQKSEVKAERIRTKRDEIVGYISLGDLTAHSEGLRDFQKRNKPNEQVTLVVLPGLQKKYVGMNRAALAKFKSVHETAVAERKAVPTIGDLVIEPARLSELVRTQEHDRLTIRDVIDISSTASDAIKYVRLTNYTRAAAAVARSAQKPQATLDLETVNETVRTIAVWMPVENQQLDDLPMLASMINGELLYDVAKAEEELIVYGDGTGENFNGILNNADVLTIGEMPDASTRLLGSDTLIDIARRGITDVRRAGYDPNAILVDPLDWEEIILEKGSDNRYVWVVVTEAGVQRLWSVTVIETVAMSNFQGVDTEQRNMLVGDFRRGATLYDRQQASIAVGYINDQFIRNQRTILAEKRSAFALKRPGAFRKYETQAASAS